MSVLVFCDPLQYNCGDIGGFSSGVVELLFAPEEVGEYTQQFQLVFSHQTVQPVSQHVMFTLVTLKSAKCNNVFVLPNVDRDFCSRKVT